ncbi:hypothetical protein ACL02O_25290 [Micromonospora sp. MS34]|uniref:hypothetical protein n=1 Tax=Micromonospora sp. MS34 TaxID=3385971 RepID=UPI0039A14034
MSRLARRVAALICVIGLAAASVLTAGPAQAGTAPSSDCTTIRQRGPTVHVTDFSGLTIASVKQFYGTCSGSQRNWSYVWIWDQAYTTWDIHVLSTGIRAETSPGEWSADLGERSGGWNQQEVKSYPTNTAYQCTKAYATIDIYHKASGYYMGFREGGTARVC